MKLGLAKRSLRLVVFVSEMLSSVTTTRLRIAEEYKLLLAAFIKANDPTNLVRVLLHCQ